MPPLLLLALLAIGSGAGVLCWRAVCGPRFTTGKPGAGRREQYLLSGTVVIGGFVAPVVQCLALTIIPAATASLLLNFEIVSTVLLAFLVFHEPADIKTGCALILIFAGSIILGWNGESLIGFSL